MERRKGKSRRSKSPDQGLSRIQQTKRQRRHQRTVELDDGTPLTPQRDDQEESQLDTSMEVDSSMNDFEDTQLEDQGDDSDDESIDWETVELPKWSPAAEHDQHEEENPQDHIAPQEQYNDVQVVFEAPRAVLKKSKWEMAYQRQLRDWMHNGHVVLLVAHFMLRNTWSSREDVKSVCLSVIPDDITSQSKEKSESDSKFGTIIKRLLAWWHDYFTVTGLGIRTRSLEIFDSIPSFGPQSNLIEELKQHIERLGLDDSETIQNPSAFINYLAEKSGSRDLSAQLFTSILRALGFETRLICSLQPIPFRIPATRSDGPSTNKKGDTIKPSEHIVHHKKLPSVSSDKKPDSRQYQSNNAKPPTVWCEVWNTHKQQWICIDPIRQFYNKPLLMEPSLSDRQNNLSFVLAFEQQDDQTSRRRRQRIKCVVDVTRRYTTHLPKALALRERELNKRERQGGWKLWSELFLHGLQPIDLRQQDKKSNTSMRYEIEQQQLEDQQDDQRMPTSIQGFHNHPVYVLERHLKKFEVLYHPEGYTRMVMGQIRGEKIYPRSCVHETHTRETWIKQGRVVMEDQVPIKRVQSRAVTLEKKRIHEDAKRHGVTLHSDCFGVWQTTTYKAPPVVDGKITKNDYGRVDLFTPEMLPEGAAHMEMDGLGKIAKQLGIDYAEAVVGFEYVRGRSIPSVNGIIIAKENEPILFEAWREHEQHKTNKALAKQERDVYRRWRKLILAAQINDQVDKEYGTHHSLFVKDPSNNYDYGQSNSTAYDRFMRHRRQEGNKDQETGFLPEDEGVHDGGFLLNDDNDDYGDDYGDNDEDEDDDDSDEVGGGFLPEDEDV